MHGMKTNDLTRSNSLLEANEDETHSQNDEKSQVESQVTALIGNSTAAVAAHGPEQHSDESSFADEDNASCADKDSASASSSRSTEAVVVSHGPKHSEARSSAASTSSRDTSKSSTDAIQSDPESPQVWDDEWSQSTSSHVIAPTKLCWDDEWSQQSSSQQVMTPKMLWEWSKANSEDIDQGLESSSRQPVISTKKKRRNIISKGFKHVFGRK
jgi:hypothetical protein